MLASVSQFIRRHDLIVPGDRVLVAVSGGSDSLALLLLLRQLADDWQLQLAAAHLDHGLRPDSGADAAFVAECCARLGVALIAERVDVPALARQRRGGPEAVAREARLDFLTRVADRLGSRVIALAHQRGDQAETVLERLLRGSGATGLAAMRPRRGAFVRPLLACSREQLQAYLQEQGWSWREDPSNRDPSFTRNRIRHQLLPVLADFNPRIEQGLVALSQRLALEEDYWDELLDRYEAELVEVVEGGVRISVAALSGLHPALRDRLLRRLLERVRGDRQRVLAVHVAALVRLLEEGPPQGELHLPGVLVRRRFDRLELGGGGAPEGVDFELAVAGPGRYLLPGELVLEVELRTFAAGEGPWVVEFAADAVAWPLAVRPFRPGDRIRLAGGGRHRVKELLRAARVPREVRAALPLVVADELLWVPGLRRCAGRRPVAGEPVLRLSLAGVGNLSNNL